MIFLFFLVFILLLASLYKLVYFSPISVVSIATEGVNIISVKPTKKFFKSFSKGYSSYFINLGNGLVAFAYNRFDCGPILTYNLLEFSSEILILRVSKGRFKNIDLSNRFVIDSISKFKFYEVIKNV